MEERKIIEIVDSGEARYCLEANFEVLGRMWDNEAEEVVVVKPERESGHACIMIVTVDGKPIEHIVVGDEPVKITNLLSRHNSVDIGFTFGGVDGYTKNTEVERFYFLKAQKPEDFVPVEPENKENLDLLIAKGFVDVELVNNEFLFYGIKGDVVARVPLSGFMQEQSDLGELDSTKVTFVKGKKTSNLENDGDGVSPFATVQFVSENGGKINSISVNGVEQPVDENKNVDIQLPENIAETNKNNNFSTSQTINGTLTVNGNIVQNGESYETHAEKVYTKNDTIILREGAVGGLGNDEYAGFEAEKYDGENTGVLGFGADGVARVGDKGNEQPLLTREESEDLSNGDVLVWNSETNRAEGSSDYVKFTDYASSKNYGVVKISSAVNGIGIDENGVMYLILASEKQIQEKNVNNPITPRNLDKAIKISLTTNTETLTDEEKATVLNWLGAPKFTATQNEVDGSYSLSITTPTGV